MHRFQEYYGIEFAASDRLGDPKLLVKRASPVQHIRCDAHFNNAGEFDFYVRLQYANGLYLFEKFFPARQTRVVENSICFDLSIPAWRGLQVDEFAIQQRELEPHLAHEEPLVRRAWEGTSVVVVVSSIKQQQYHIDPIVAAAAFCHPPFCYVNEEGRMMWGAYNMTFDEDDWLTEDIMVDGRLWSFFHSESSWHDEAVGVGFLADSYQLKKLVLHYEP